MIPSTAPVHNVSKTGETLRSVSYSLDSSPAAFRILFDSIYTNKIKAVVRELWSNALDAHIAIGNVKPFNCHLPTPLEPWFEVRDFGVSMSDDEVMGLYSAMFRSSKTETNDLTGMLGLGSKAPFAYVDSFTVKAWSDGRERIYVATVEASGIPSINAIADFESNEPNGISVSFPVKPEDHATFVHEAELMGRGYDVLPNMTGASCNFNTMRVVLEVENVKLVRSDGYLIIRQGSVLYPVSAESLGHRYADRVVSYGYAIMITLPLGSVQVAASREALSLDDVSLEFVKKAYVDAAGSLYATIASHVNGAPTRLERAKRFAQCNAAWDGVLSILDDKGEKIISDRIDIRKTKSMDINLRSISDNTVASVYYRDLSLLTVLLDRGEKMIRRSRRLKAFEKENKHSKILIMSNPIPSHVARIVRLLGLNKDQVQDIRSIPDPYAEEAEERRLDRKNGGTGGGLAGVYVRNSYGNKIVKADSAPKDGFLFVEISRGNMGSYVTNQGLGGSGMLDGHFLTNVLPDILDVLYWKNQNVFFLTPAAMKRYDAKKVGVDVMAVAHQWKLRNLPLHREAIIHNRVVAGLGAGARSVLKMEMKTDPFYDHYWARFQYSVDMDTEVAARSEGLKKKYPMLFPADEATVQAYVDLMDHIELTNAIESAKMTQDSNLKENA